MKVYIITEGGKNIGLGHITRCVSIYQAFEEAGAQSQLIINGDETVQDSLKGKNCKVFDWLNKKKLLFDILGRADIVFIDSYLADVDLYERVSDTAWTAVYFDDNMRIEYPKGFVLNGAIGAEQMPYPKRKGTTYLLGAQYAPLRREFWDVPAKSIRDNIETILITFGGADIHNLTPKVLKLLIDACPKLLKKVIIAKGFQNIAEIERLKDNNTELIYYPNSAEMKKAMLESDIAISGGGQTLYELARVRVPTIAVTVADNQVNNACILEKVGFVEYAGHWDNAGMIETISQGVKLLRSKSIRQHKCKIGRKVVDGTGSSRIVKEVLSSFYRPRFTFRQATLADAQEVFDLANDDIVRKGSFESGPIDWDDHFKWLRAKLGDSKCFFFIVDCQGEFAGQVRFDIIPDKKETEISISLQKYMRGLGMSAFIISRSIEKLLETRKEVKVVKAYIKQSNIASIKSFEGAGFKLLKNFRIKGHQSGVYERAAEYGQK